MNLTKAEIVFFTLFTTMALVILGLIIWLVDTTPNCWTYQPTEQTGIVKCEHHE